MVQFVAPMSAADLRVVLANTTVQENGDWAVVYRTQYGEVRMIPYLTATEAASRADKLRKRGYRVVAGQMD